MYYLPVTVKNSFSFQFCDTFGPLQRVRPERSLREEVLKKNEQQYYIYLHILQLTEPNESAQKLTTNFRSETYFNKNTLFKIPGFQEWQLSSLKYYKLAY
jgi:hypothetical protein